jgi:WD40-like Beta Propeller Repeat
MKKLNIRIIEISTIISMLAVVVMSPIAAQAQYSGINGRIISNANSAAAGGLGAVSVKPDGSNYFGHNIGFVNTGTLVKQFSYSPDGATVAYSQLSGTDAHIYTKAAGSFAATGTQITTGTDVVDGDASFSPDGSKIAFERFTASVAYGTRDIYVMNADGTGPITRLTKNMYVVGTTAESVNNPIWRADGLAIYVGMDNGGTDPATGGDGIYSISPTTPDQSTATNIIPSGSMPGFTPSDEFDIAPGGLRFIYQSGNNVRSVASTGAGDTAVVTSDATYQYTVGSYSPDGQKVVVIRTDLSKGTTDMIVMNTDGTSQTVIVNGIDYVSSTNGPFLYGSGNFAFWGTNQDTYDTHGAFENGETTPGAPNTTSVSSNVANYIPAILAMLSTLAFMALAGFYIKKEYLSNRK